jgi:hypothetical protein
METGCADNVLARLATEKVCVFESSLTFDTFSSTGWSLKRMLICATRTLKAQIKVADLVATVVPHQEYNVSLAIITAYAKAWKTDTLPLFDWLAHREWVVLGTRHFLVDLGAYISVASLRLRDQCKLKFNATRFAVVPVTLYHTAVEVPPLNINLGPAPIAI